LTDVRHFHHVAHLVSDMVAALDLYGALGFDFDPPRYVTVATDDQQEAAQVVGAANAHGLLDRSFLELATSIAPGSETSIPPNAKFHKIVLPKAAMEGFMASLTKSSESMTTWINQFEGLHIVAFETDRLDDVHTRLGGKAIPNNGITVVPREIETADGPAVIETRFIELGVNGGVPEGRVVVAEGEAEKASGTGPTSHRNGAHDLVEVILSADRADLPELEARYSGYLDRSAQSTGSIKEFALDAARVVLVPSDSLGDILPGEEPSASPAIIGFGVRVADIAQSRAFVEGQKFATASLTGDDFFVSSKQAMGASVIFRSRTLQ
jgi:hypothetical protein